MRTLVITVIILTAIIAALYNWRYELGWSAVFIIKPPGNFSHESIGPAPNYHANEAWIAHGKGDNSEIGAVFYIHPTTLLKGKTWNQPLEDAQADSFLESLAPKQIEIFKQWPVYAPYYRQAAFYSFIDKSESGKLARQLASSDVVAAFKVFASQHTGPIIIAGHSQGSYHAVALIEALRDEPELLARVAVVYAIGYPIPIDYVSSNTPFRECRSPDQVNCVLSFNARDRIAYIPSFLSSVPMPSGEKTHNPLMCWNLTSTETVVSGECNEDGWLVVKTPPEEYRDFLMSRGWYHTVEYKLFPEAFQKDARARLAQWEF